MTKLRIPGGSSAVGMSIATRRSSRLSNASTGSNFSDTLRRDDEDADADADGEGEEGEGEEGGGDRDEDVKEEDEEMEETKTRSGRVTKIKRGAFVESDSDADGEAEKEGVEGLFDNDEGVEEVVKPKGRALRSRTRSKKSDEDDEEEEEEEESDEPPITRAGTRTRSRTRAGTAGRKEQNLRGFVEDDDEDLDDGEGTYGRRRLRSSNRQPPPPPEKKKRTAAPRDSGDWYARKPVTTGKDRAARNRRREKEQDGDWVVASSEGDGSVDVDGDGDGDGEVDDLDIEMDDAGRARAAAREAEKERKAAESDPKGYHFRQRQKVNYAIPPPLTDANIADAARASSRPPPSHTSRRAPTKRKGLGWNASGADLARAMGDYDSSDDGMPSRAGVPKGAAGGGVLAGAGGGLYGGGGAGGDMPSGGPSNFGKVGDAQLADADPLGVNQNVTFDEVGGLDEHIQSLKEMTLLPLLYPEVFQQFNITPPRGVLFHGPPGTGKTLMARALAASCRMPPPPPPGSSTSTSASATTSNTNANTNTNANFDGKADTSDNQKDAADPSNADGKKKDKPAQPTEHKTSTSGTTGVTAAPEALGGRKIAFFMRKGADALSKWVGEAERQLRLLFDEARASQPSIIFFDEIDGLAPVRSSKQDQVHASIVSTLLALMDGMDGRGQVVVIGATNRPDAIDPALRRPGRFDREFYFGLPDVKARERILGIMTKGWEGWGVPEPASSKPKEIEGATGADAERGEMGAEGEKEGGMGKEKEGETDAEKTMREERIRGLAEMTKGFGGADLRALCTEAALNAIQRRYPQIYSTQHRLLLDPSSIRVGVRDFVLGIKKMIPSSARSSTTPAAALPVQFEPLLGEVVGMCREVIEKVMPMEKKPSALEEAMWEDEGGEEGALKREIGGQELTRLRTHKPRLLIHGDAGMGQKFVGSAVLQFLEGYTVQSLELGGLLGDSTRTIEAAIVQLFVEAKRHQPSIIYIPSMSSWAKAITPTALETVKSMLDTLSPSDPILLLGVVDAPFSSLPKPIRRWFGAANKESRVSIARPEPEQIAKFFEPLLDDARKPPNGFADGVKRKKRVLEELPIAPPLSPRKPSEAEVRAQEEADGRLLTLLKYRLGQILSELKRKYRRFCKSATDEYRDYFAMMAQREQEREERMQVDGHQDQQQPVAGPSEGGVRETVTTTTETIEVVNPDGTTTTRETITQEGSTQPVPQVNGHVVNGITYGDGEGQQMQMQAQVHQPPPQTPASAAADEPTLYDMDLERMHILLYKNRYLTPAEFLADVGKILHNAEVRGGEDLDRYHKAAAMYNATELSVQDFDKASVVECERMREREVVRKEVRRKKREEERKKEGKGKEKDKDGAGVNGNGGVGTRRSARMNGKEPELTLTDPARLERRLKRQRSDAAGLGGDATDSSEADNGGGGVLPGLGMGGGAMGMNGMDGRESKRAKMEMMDGRDGFDMIGAGGVPRTPMQHRQGGAVRFAEGQPGPSSFPGQHMQSPPLAQGAMGYGQHQPFNFAGQQPHQTPYQLPHFGPGVPSPGYGSPMTFHNPQHHPLSPHHQQHSPYPQQNYQDYHQQPTWPGSPPPQGVQYHPFQQQQQPPQNPYMSPPPQPQMHQPSPSNFNHLLNPVSPRSQQMPFPPGHPSAGLQAPPPMMQQPSLEHGFPRTQQQPDVNDPFMSAPINPEVPSQSQQVQPQPEPRPASAAQATGEPVEPPTKPSTPVPPQPSTPENMVVEEKERTPTPLPDFVVPEESLESFKTRLIKETESLTIEQLEQIRASLLGCVWRHRKEWDRSELVVEMGNVLGNLVDEMKADEEDEDED